MLVDTSWSWVVDVKIVWGLISKIGCVLILDIEGCDLDVEWILASSMLDKWFHFWCYGLKIEGFVISTICEWDFYIEWLKLVLVIVMSVWRLDWRLLDIGCSILLRVIDFGLSTNLMVEIRFYGEVLTMKAQKLILESQFKFATDESRNCLTHWYDSFLILDIECVDMSRLITKDIVIGKVILVW